MRILITGGAGFIGSHFLSLLTSSSESGINEIVVLDSLTYAGNLENLEHIDSSHFRFVHADIRDYETLSKEISRSDVVVNFAAETHVDNSIKDSDRFIQSNIVGVQNILNILKTYPDKRLVHISTDEVYGTIATGSWTEESVLAPNSPYSASKASSDLILLAHKRTFDLDIVITRASNNYGIRQYPEKLIPHFISKLLSDEQVPLYGDGMNIRDWLHVLDHCRGILLATKFGKSGEIYNFGGNDEHTNLKVTELILEILNLSKDRIDFVSDRPAHDFRYSVSSAKASSELGWSPNNRLKEELPGIVKWYSERALRTKVNLK